MICGTGARSHGVGSALQKDKNENEKSFERGRNSFMLCLHSGQRFSLLRWTVDWDD